jgi:hypothetical protein
VPELLGLHRTSAEAELKLGSIRKQGDRYLRSLFTVGALALIRYAKIHGIMLSSNGCAPMKPQIDLNKINESWAAAEENGNEDAA